MILPILGSVVLAIDATVSTLASDRSLPASESIRSSSFLPRPVRKRPTIIANEVTRAKATNVTVMSEPTAKTLSFEETGNRIRL